MPKYQLISWYKNVTYFRGFNYIEISANIHLIRFAQVCQTQYETSCVTKYKDTPVVENVEECNKVKYKLEYHDNSFVETFENEKQD